MIVDMGAHSNFGNGGEKPPKRKKVPDMEKKAHNKEKKGPSPRVEFFLTFQGGGTPTLAQ